MDCLKKKLKIVLKRLVVNCIVNNISLILYVVNKLKTKKPASLVGKQKVIFHMDGDAFFVACEVAKNPKLKGLPVVTGEERGIVSALSYEAKALGITRGMPIFTIWKKFPQVLILPGDYLSYAKYSRKMFDIVRRYADEVEEYRIDECFAELTGLDRPLYMTYLEIAERIKKEVNEELGLSVSIGLGPSKVLAKVASKWQKPNGLTEILKNTALEFLRKTPIEKIWGIGPRTSEFLQRRGISTAGDFAKKNQEWIKINLPKPYEVIWLELNCISVMKIDSKPKTDYSSIQKTKTFHPPTNDEVFLLSQLSKHIEDACRKARHYGLTSKKVFFFLKTQGFKYCGCEIKLLTPSDAPEVLISLVDEHFKKIHTKGILYRSAGVVLQELKPESVLQADLFGEGNKTKRFEKIHKQIDSLEKKFGKRLVYLGVTHKALKGKVSSTDTDDLDRDLLFL